MTRFLILSILMMAVPAHAQQGCVALPQYRQLLGEANDRLAHIAGTLEKMQADLARLHDEAETRRKADY